MDALPPSYLELVKHYENCFEKFGTTPQGVDWPNAHDAQVRFEVMLEMCKLSSDSQTIDLLDLGCGYGALLDVINTKPYRHLIRYKGIDLSEKMIVAANKYHSSRAFEQRNLLTHPLSINSFDYVIMNGLFTEKLAMSQQDMEQFFSAMIATAFATARVGIAFNVMSTQVDWFRDDLFHLSFDRSAHFVKLHCSRHFVIRSDYGLYEYTVYVYKNPRNHLSKTA